MSSHINLLNHMPLALLYCNDSYARYTTDEILKDLEVIFYRYHHPSDNVFVAHSYGTSLVAFLLQQLPRKVTETVRACAMCSPTLEGPSGV